MWINVTLQTKILSDKFTSSVSNDQLMAHLKLKAGFADGGIDAN